MSNLVFKTLRLLRIKELQVDSIDRVLVGISENIEGFSDKVSDILAQKFKVSLKAFGYPTCHIRLVSRISELCFGILEL